MKSDGELGRLRELRVIDLSRGGAGVAREESGRVVFIPLTAPGDRVRVRILKEDKSYAHAELVEVLEGSSIRQIPPCPVFGRCGGCQWQHLPYSFQWETKTKGVIQVLSRVGITPPPSVDLIPAERVWEYRNRVQLRGEGGHVGFFQEGSRELVSTDRCWIARPEINQEWEMTRSEGSRLGKPFKVEVEVMPGGEVRRTWNQKHSANGFRQVHDEQNQRLQGWILQESLASDILYDLFGGAGNLSLPLADKMKEVHCVDLSVPKNPPFGTPSHFHFHRDSVLRWLLKRAGQQSPAVSSAFAILDPPRSGLGGDVAEISSALIRLHVTRLVIVGCDADAWARDLRCWVQEDWKIQKIMMIDLFPQTSQVESVAILQRPGFIL